MAADRPWYRQVTTGYVLRWGNDYMAIDGETRCRTWVADKRAAIKLPRAVAVDVLRSLRRDNTTAGKARILRRYKVIPDALTPVGRWQGRGHGTRLHHMAR